MFRNVSALASGLLVAQAIMLLSSPLLTRLYSPEGFAVLGLFSAFIGSLSPGVCGRYEIAQAVVKSRRERDLLFSLSIWVATLLSILLLAAVFCFRETIIPFFSASHLGRVVFVFPAGLFLFGAIQALRFFANSEKQYAAIGRMSVFQALGTIVAAVALALVTSGQSGLVFSTVFGYLLAVVYMVLFFREPLSSLRIIPSRLHLRIAYKYRQFPFYNATSSILDGITLSMPVFFLLRDYPEAIVGYYALLVRVAAAPIGFISKAVSEVHLRRIAEMMHRSEPALDYLLLTTAILGGVILVPAMLFLFAAPRIFEVVFGAEWREAGTLLQIIMPALALKFVVSTLSGVFSGTGNNKLGAAWKVGAFVVTFGMFYVFSGATGVRTLFILMMVADLVLYSVYYALIVYSVKNPREIT